MVPCICYKYYKLSCNLESLSRSTSNSISCNIDSLTSYCISSLDDSHINSIVKIIPILILRAGLIIAAIISQGSPIRLVINYLSQLLGNIIFISTNGGHHNNIGLTLGLFIITLNRAHSIDTRQCFSIIVINFNQNSFDAGLSSVNIRCINFGNVTTNILHSHFQIRFQRSACREGCIISSILIQSSDHTASQSSISNRILLSVIRLGAVGAASQHGDSHDTGQHQGSNFLELHSEFFLLMVYKR